MQAYTQQFKYSEGNSETTVGLRSPKEKVLCKQSCKNKIGKVYSLEYTEITKVFFTPHHGG
jgi:hypothetical protein